MFGLSSFQDVHYQRINKGMWFYYTLCLHNYINQGDTLTVSTMRVSQCYAPFTPWFSLYEIKKIKMVFSALQLSFISFASSKKVGWIQRTLTECMSYIITAQYPIQTHSLQQSKQVLVIRNRNSGLELVANSPKN